jgi:hypothetical protein
MMEVIKTLKGGSLSRTEVIVYRGRKFVRKFISSTENKEYGLVRWQSQVRKLQILNRYIPDSCIKIEKMGVIEQGYYYDTPFYETGLNGFEAIMNGVSIDTIANEVDKLLSKMVEIKLGQSKGALSIYLNEEVYSPLCLALRNVNKSQLPLRKEEFDLFRNKILIGIDIVRKMVEELSDEVIEETLTHGNLTLENMLWDTEKEKLILIDPYAETYCETIIGDVSQLLQSSESGYEFVSAFFDSNDIKVGSYPRDEIPNGLREFSKKILNLIANHTWYSERHLHIMKASQFIRMYPFKIIKAPRQGVAFMMHGIELLEQSRC